jgi:hypothetical protein
VHIEYQAAAADDKVGKVTILVGPGKINTRTDATMSGISPIASPGQGTYLMIWGGQLNGIL